MHTWTWQQWKGFPYLTCSLLAPFSHGFFTRQCAPLLPGELTIALDAEAEPYRLWQVHGKTVLAPSEIQRATAAVLRAPAEGESALPQGDGVMTERSRQGAWVCSADCVPALIADAENGHVAAVHAGWRGTAAQILPEAIARLKAQGSRIEHLRVALGPAIDGSVYQVTTAVAAEVGASLVSKALPAKLHQRSPDEIASILEALGQFPDSPLLPDPQPGRVRLDVRRVNALQLEFLGLALEQVAIAPYCTYQNPSHFFSYRRSSEKKVQWSGIVSRTESA